MTDYIHQLSETLSLLYVVLVLIFSLMRLYCLRFAFQSLFGLALTYTNRALSEGSLSSGFTTGYNQTNHSATCKSIQTRGLEFRIKQQEVSAYTGS